MGATGASLHCLAIKIIILCQNILFKTLILSWVQNLKEIQKTFFVQKSKKHITNIVR